MRIRELQSLIKLAEDLNNLARENHDWCKKNKDVSSVQILATKAGACTAYADATKKILDFIKANERGMD